MSNRRVLDVSGLPPYDVSNHAPLWLGQLCLVAVEGTIFGILIAMYFYYRLSVDVWPPPGTKLPGVLNATLALFILLASTIGSYIASEGAKKNERSPMIFGLVLNVALAFVFLGLRWLEMRSLNFTWAADVHGSVVWTILGMHTLDVVADLLFTIVLLVLVVLGRTDARVRLGVHVDSVVWYFLVAIWVPLYVVIFWGPRLVGTPR